MITALQVWLIIWPGFVLGIFHTLMPCEDKAIFFFYIFGTSKTPRSAFGSVTLYGLGLLCANMFIGTIASIFGGLIFQRLNQHVNNALGAISIIISSFIMIYQIRTHKWRPHSQQTGEIKDSFNNDNGRLQKRTIFLLGLLAGIPPCVFELAVYSQAIFVSSSSIINGVLTVFSFGIGTWLGLFPLAAFGLLGPIARNRFEKPQSSEKKTSNSLNPDKPESNNEPISRSIANTEDNERSRKLRLQLLKNTTGFNKRSGKIIEWTSALLLMALGITILILALLGINIFTWPAIPTV